MPSCQPHNEKLIKAYGRKLQTYEPIQTVLNSTSKYAASGRIVLVLQQVVGAGCLVYEHTSKTMVIYFQDSAHGELTRFSPQIRQIFPLGNIRSREIPVVLTTRHNFRQWSMCLDVSVTEANLNNASFQWGCNCAAHRSVFVQLSLRKRHLFSGVAGSLQYLTESKGAGGRRAARAYNFKLLEHDGETIIRFACQDSSVVGFKDDMT